MGITEVVSAARSPWQNASVERMIGSIRRECLDYIVNLQPTPSPSHALFVRGLLPPQPHASFTRQGLPGPAPGHANQEWESRCLPASQWLASPLRTSRYLIHPRSLLTNGWTAAALRGGRSRDSSLSDLNKKR